MILRTSLKVWGWLALICGVFDLIMEFYAATHPTVTYYSGSMGWMEWIGMGLLSLGVARCIELLERKN